MRVDDHRVARVLGDGALGHRQRTRVFEPQQYVGEVVQRLCIVGRDLQDVLVVDSGARKIAGACVVVGHGLANRQVVGMLLQPLLARLCGLAEVLR